ncbi:MAG TPA: GNAT family N-acetyltransferase [Clostridiaceae bacterium]|jgi:GNAT superfamily N-acetyltransferase|nr:GNAT family N-acetyltransferase [Clostridiaceae bacterium]
MNARFARYDDLKGIMGLYEILHPDDEKASSSPLENVWDEIMSNPGRYRYAVVEENDRLVATCNIAVVPNLTRTGRPYAVIENVVTHPDFRRKGYGSVAIQLLLDFAREQNCYKVMLLSSAKREEAHEFYKSLGFDGDSKCGFVYYPDER